MKYLLYLWRSILRRPKRHFTLYSILTCAFLLPLVISIYRDSCAYGSKQLCLDWSKGFTYHISNASAEDVQFFEDIAGLSQPLFEEGTIYLRVLSDDEWKNEHNLFEYDQQVLGRMTLTGNQKLDVKGFNYFLAHGIPTDPFYDMQQRVLFWLNVFIILVSVLVAQSAYKSHLRRFSPEVGTLISCGADQRKIRLIFTVEFITVFFLASLSSILISIGVMKLLFLSLEIKNVSGLAWVIYHVNPVNILLHLLVYFVSSAVILGYSLWRYSKDSTWTLLHNDAAVQKPVRYKQIDIAPPPAAALSRLWCRRTNRSLNTCLLISVPIMTIFLFLFNYSILDIDFITEAPEYELQVSRSEGVFSEEDIEYVENIPGVLQVQQYQNERQVPPELSEDIEPLIYSQLNISLERPDMHSQVENILREHFGGADYSIANRQESVDYMIHISVGIYFLLAYIFCILSLFVLIILYIKLCDYIEGCSETIRSLYVIGASRQDLYRSYIRQIIPTAVAAAITPIVISEILSVFAASSMNASAVVNGAVITVYIAVAAFILGFYLYPAHRTLKNILRQL